MKLKKRRKSFITMRNKVWRKTSIIGMQIRGQWQICSWKDNSKSNKYLKWHSLVNSKCSIIRFDNPLKNSILSKIIPNLCFQSLIMITAVIYCELFGKKWLLTFYVVAILAHTCILIWLYSVKGTCECKDVVTLICDLYLSINSTIVLRQSYLQS